MSDSIKRCELVVVGASLGGLAAVKQLFEPLDKQFGAAIVLVQHRRADADSRLAQILSSMCSLPVLEPEDKEAIKPGHIYIAPANYHLLVQKGWLWLSVDAPVWFARPSIDVTFESAAEAYSDALTGLVLTGSNEDGAAGARAIKRAGGTVLVQDPRTAESPIAPQATLAATAVDGVLTLDEMSRRLGRIGMTTPAVRRRPSVARRSP